MKMRILFLLITAISFWSFSSENDHKFYVSNTVIAENPRTNSVEITIRIFTDDLENALESTFETESPLLLGEENESEEAERFLEEYIRENFKLDFNGHPSQLLYIGKEVEYDLCYVYFEIPITPQFNALKMQNSILLDLFEEQVNITHLRFSGWEQTIYFDSKMPEQVITR